MSLPRFRFAVAHISLQDIDKALHDEYMIGIFIKVTLTENKISHFQSNYNIGNNIGNIYFFLLNQTIKCVINYSYTLLRPTAFKQSTFYNFNN